MKKKKTAGGESPILKERSQAEKIVFFIVGVIFTLYAVSLIYPFVWVFINSLKGALE